MKAGLLLSLALLYAGSVSAQTQTSVQTGASASGQASAQASPMAAPASAHGGGAASTSTQDSGAQSSAALADGTAFNATLDKPVDSKKCKPGDPVTAHTTEPVKSGGKTVLPKGTKMVGHVTQSSARRNGEANSTLGIVFDKAVMSDGQQMPLKVVIQALGAASENASAAAGNTETMEGGRGYSDASATANTGGGRGALRGVTSAGGGAAGGITNTAAAVGNTSSGTLNAATTPAFDRAANGAAGTLNAAGRFTSNSRGVFGINGLNLSPATAGDAQQGSLITSTGKNVHLDSGTRMLLVSESSASATR